MVGKMAGQMAAMMGLRLADSSVVQTAACWAAMREEMLVVNSVEMTVELMVVVRGSHLVELSADE